MLEIKYSLFDVTAKQDSTPACSDKQAFVELSEINSEDLVFNKYATLERNQFILDGSMPFFPAEPSSENFGLWSLQMSDSNGDFATPIVLTLTFTANHSSLGLTLFFRKDTNDYCNDMTITYYDSSDTVLLTKDYTPDRPDYFADGQVEDYRKIVITFRGTNYPNRYLKLSEVKYGALKVFGEDDIILANMLEEVDILSNELSINTLEFSVYTKDFALLDPTGVYSMLQQKQEIEVVDGDTLGTFYLDEPTSDSDDTTAMKCIDLVGIIDGTEFKGGIYSSKSVATLVSEIMASAGAAYELDSSFIGTVSGWIPICSHRAALQQVAFAIGAVVDCSRSDKIKIYPAPTVVSGTITHESKFDGHTVKLKALVTGVEVTSHKYIAGSESRAVFEDTLPVGTHFITFDAPYHTLSATGATITESGANYAKVTVTTAGTVTITGSAYVDSTSVVGVFMQELPANAKENILQITDATLVSPSDALAVAQRIYNYYQKRYEDEGEIELEAETVGMWKINSLNGRDIIGYIESLDTDLVTGISKIKMTGEAVARDVE